jgi:hypothetical protein
MLRRRSPILAAALALCVLPPFLAAQAETKPAFGISFSGFIKTDMIYDTRQTANLREGHFLILPKGPSYDGDGTDINAVPTFHMLSVQTRLVGKITGPDALGAKTSGLIEGEFFGTSDGDINGFRLRHAYVRLNWPTTELLVGQFWHPMFVTESFPEVVSFNTGAPFQAFNRSPQVRLTQQIGPFSLIATALSQRDFVSNGPDGASSVYARTSAVPELNLRLQFFYRCPRGCETLVGVGGDFKSIRPRTATPLGYATEARLPAFAGMVYLRHKSQAFTLKAETVYGEDLHHLTMLGGYGVSGITDVARGIEAYAPLRTMSSWVEIQTNGEKLQAGLFAGQAKNLGAAVDLRGPAWGRATNVDEVLRVAPRLVYNAGKLRLAAEVEWTSAGYGTPDARGKVVDAERVTNLRCLGAVYYFF